MCVILVSKGGVRVPRWWAREAWEINGDGGGVAFHGRDGWVVVRGLLSFREWWRVYSRACDGGGSVVAHLRLRSTGPVGADFTHPLPIPGHPGWWLAHNGTLTGWRALEAASGASWDSAAAAWLLSRTRRGRWVSVLESLGGRWVLMGPFRLWRVGAGWRVDHPVKGVQVCGCLPGEWSWVQVTGRGQSALGRGSSAVGASAGARAGAGGRVVSFGGGSSGASGSWESSDWLLRGWSHVD